MAEKWFLVADGSRARLFVANEAAETFEMAQSFDNPEGRARADELVTNERGMSRPRQMNSARANIELSHPKDIEVKRFAKDLADRLGTAHQQSKFASLHLIAPPQFLGLLRSELPGHMLNEISDTAKDYTHKKDHEIADFLRENGLIQVPPPPRKKV